MEVKLDKRYPVAAGIEPCWAVLRDIRAVAACMPGAQITQQIDDTHFKGTVKSKVGPAVMSFGGDIELQGLDAAARSLKMLGKGADKAGSSASMQLTAHLEPGDGAAQTVLVGQATIVVSGKLAQFGSRLLVPVSDAMLAQFADNFRAAALAQPVAVADAPVTAPLTALGTAGAPAPVAAAADAPAPSAAPGSALGSAPGTAPVAPAVAAGPPSTAAPAPAPAPPPMPVARPVQELNALGLLWTVFKGWLAGLFGKKP